MVFRTVAAGVIVISTSALADEPAELARVEVVGSRVPRLDGETALPVQIIRREVQTMRGPCVGNRDDAGSPGAAGVLGKGG